MVTPTHYQPLLSLSQNTSQTRHKILLFSLSLVAFFSLSYFTLLFTQIHQPNNPNTINNYSPLAYLCDQSHDPTSCLSLIFESISTNHPTRSSSLSSNGHDLLGKIISRHVSHINTAIEATKKINTFPSSGALADCLELMDLSRDHLANSIKALAKSNYNTNNDINTWLSAVLTNHVTCSDQLHDDKNPQLLLVKSVTEGLISGARALLAIQARLSSPSENVLEGSRSRIWYPNRVRRDRKLLEASGSDIEANVTVAKDGCGNFTTVGEAVASVPEKGKFRYVIYVKEGVYEENIEVGKNMKNVMIVGDGMNKTVITGSLNVFDGSTTFRSATLGQITTLVCLLLQLILQLIL